MPDDYLSRTRIEALNKPKVTQETASQKISEREKQEIGGFLKEVKKNPIKASLKYKKPSQMDYVYPKPSEGKPKKKKTSTSQKKASSTSTKTTTTNDYLTPSIPTKSIYDVPPPKGGLVKPPEFEKIPEDVIASGASSELVSHPTVTATPEEIPSSFEGATQKALVESGQPAKEPVEILTGETYSGATRHKYRKKAKPEYVGVPAVEVEKVMEQEGTTVLKDKQKELAQKLWTKQYIGINPYTGEPEYAYPTEEYVYYGMEPKDDIDKIVSDLSKQKQFLIGTSTEPGLKQGIETQLESITEFEQKLPELKQLYEKVKTSRSNKIILTELDEHGNPVTREYTKNEALRRIEDAMKIKITEKTETGKEMTRSYTPSEARQMLEEKLEEINKDVERYNRAINYFKAYHNLGYEVVEKNGAYQIKPPSTEETFEYLYGKNRLDVLGASVFSKSFLGLETYGSAIAGFVTGDKKYMESEVESLMKYAVGTQKHKVEYGFWGGLGLSVIESPAVQTGTILLASEVATPLILSGGESIISGASTRVLPKASELVGKLPSGARTVISTGAKAAKYTAKSFGKVAGTKAGGFLMTANLYAAMEVPHLAETYVKAPERFPAELVSGIGNWAFFSLAVGEGAKKYQARQSLVQRTKDEFGDWVLLPEGQGKMRSVKYNVLKIDQNVKLTGKEFTPEQVGIKIKTVSGEPANVRIKQFTFSSGAKQYSASGEPLVSSGRGWVLTSEKPAYILYGGKEIPISKNIAFVYGQASTPIYETSVNPLAEIQSKSRQLFKVTGKTDFDKLIRKQVGISLSEFSGIGKFEKLGEKTFVFKTHGLSYESKQLLFTRGGISEKPIDLLTRSYTKGAGKIEKGVFVEKTPRGFRFDVGKVEKTTGFGVSENIYEKNLLFVKGKTISSEKLVGGKPIRRFGFSSSKSATKTIQFEKMLENLVGQSIAVQSAKTIGKGVSHAPLIPSGVVTVGGAGVLAAGRVSLKKLDEMEAGVDVSSGYWTKPSIKQGGTQVIGADIKLLGIQQGETLKETEKISSGVGEIPVATGEIGLISETETETIGSSMQKSFYDTMQSQKSMQKLSSLRRDMFLGNEELLTTTPVPQIKPNIITPRVPYIPMIEKEKKKRKKTFGKQKQRSYDVFVKNKKDNKYFRVNRKPLTREDALSMGATIVDETTSSVFKIKPAKGKPGMPNIMAKPFFTIRKKFYEEKPNSFIEKKTHRVDTIGEQLGVSARDWLTGGKGLKLLKKKKQKNKYSKLGRRLI